jgi:spore germination protein GerM
MEVDGKDHASVALRREITPVALNRRLGGPQSQSGLLSLSRNTTALCGSGSPSEAKGVLKTDLSLP